MAEQRCVICAWREKCAKRFSVSDGGARCPDFTRDVSIKNQSCDCGDVCKAEECKSEHS